MPVRIFFNLHVILFLLSVLCFSSFSVTSHANPKYAGLVIDADTGTILYQENANRYRYPASLTKMMTLYMTFEALQKGKLRYNQKLYVSKRAAAKPASKLGLRKGQTITVRDAVMSLIVKSANDSAVVLAEAISGSEWKFARQMTNKARKLGMRNTTFRNASGLHHRKQRTTAYDMARLSVALKRDFPQHYPLFKRTNFKFKGRTIYGHNRVVKTYRGADGLKTGYTRASGFNLATSATRNDMNVIGIVLGGKSSKSRDRHMKKILDRGFRRLAKVKKTQATRFAKAPIPKFRSAGNKTYMISQNAILANKNRGNYNISPRPQFKTTSSRHVVEQKTASSTIMRPVLKPRVHIPDQFFKNRRISKVSRSRNFIPIPVYKPHPNYILSETSDTNRKHNLIELVSSHYDIPGSFKQVPN